VFGIDGFPVAYLDLGWADWKVGVEYDGDLGLEMLEEMGWLIVRVVAEDRPASIVRRVKAAIAVSSVR